MATPADPDFPCSLTLDIPLPNKRLATTALDSINVDKELSPLVRRKLYVEEAPGGTGADPTLLKVEYQAATNRMLRVAVNSFMDSLKLVVEVMEQLDLDVLELHNQNNHKPPS